MIVYIFVLVNSDEKSQVLLGFDVISKTGFFHTTFWLKELALFKINVAPSQ